MTGLCQSGNCPALTPLLEQSEYGRGIGSPTRPHQNLKAGSSRKFFRIRVHQKKASRESERQFAPSIER